MQQNNPDKASAAPAVTDGADYSDIAGRVSAALERLSGEYLPGGPFANASARLKLAVEALERIAASRAGDMNTLHPDNCAMVAAEAIAAIRARDTLTKLKGGGGGC